MTSTELAAQIAASPRFRNIESGYFDEMAAKYGRDLTGLAFIQACLKVDQDG